MSKLTRRTFLGNTALAAFFGTTSRALSSVQDPPLSWRNWSGGEVSYPISRYSPATEEQLARFFATSHGLLRPVGSGHSFSPLVPTDGHLVVIDQLTGLLAQDEGRHLATFAAGTRLSDMGPVLAGVGQGMLNLPDIDRQTLAGATATATHGTGIDFKCLSGYVTGLRLITVDGGVRDLDTSSEPDLFAAACVSLGALGVVSRMTLQNRAAYRLKQRTWVERTSTLLQDFDSHMSAHRHFELFPLVHSDYSMALATDETDEAINNPAASPEEDAAFDNAMRGFMMIPPSLRRPLINTLAEQIGPSERVDTSYKILANIRNNRFNEMEYSVPVEAGSDCLQEILATIQDKQVDVVFPLEYRYVSRDDTMLGMSSGDEDHAAISIHRVATEDYRPYFDLIEPIFWKYGGRPHWGKIHSLGGEQLAGLYPRFDEFAAIRRALDPQGRLLNAHLRKVFGETT